MKTEKTFEEKLREFAEELENIDKPRPISAVEHNRRQRQAQAQTAWEERQRELSVIAKQNAMDTAWQATLDARREAAFEAGEDAERRLFNELWREAKKLERQMHMRQRQHDLGVEAMTSWAVADALKGSGR